MNPGTSTRRVAVQDGVNASSVWRTLQHQLLYPWHIQCLQSLKNTDFLRRLTFCQQIQQQSTLDRQFLNNVLFRDEAGFTRDAFCNFHNCHLWAAVNLNEVKQERHQQSFSFIACVGILGDCLIGPHFIPIRLKGQKFLRFLWNDLPNLLEDVPLRQRQQMWCMHDGAPAHSHLSVRRNLNRRYGERWIGRRRTSTVAS